MTIMQTVVIPDDRRITLEVPHEVPPGRTILTFTPETVPQGQNVKSLRSLLGIHRGLDTMDAYFARKRADKAVEDAWIEQSLRKNNGT